MVYAVIPVLRGLRQDDWHEFEATLPYIVSIRQTNWWTKWDFASATACPKKWRITMERLTDLYVFKNGNGKLYLFCFIYAFWEFHICAILQHSSSSVSSYSFPFPSQIHNLLSLFYTHTHLIFWVHLILFYLYVCVEGWTLGLDSLYGGSYLEEIDSSSPRNM